MGKSASKVALAAVLAVAVQTTSAHATIAEWALSFEKLLGGLKVFDRQISGSQQQTQQVIKKSVEASVSAINAQEMAFRLADLKSKFDYDTGQGDHACELASGRAGISSTDDSQRRMLSAFSSGETRYINSGGDAAQSMKTSLLKRIGHYCTEEEALFMGSTYCRSTERNERNAGDSNAAAFLLNRNYGSAEVITAGDYLDVFAAFPTIQPDASTGADTVNLVDARLQAAAMSAARSSMMGVVVSGMGGDEQK